MATVDVLIPFYNDSHGFKKTLDSIKAQTCLPQLRIVAVDDGSIPEHAKNVAALLDQSGVPYRLITNVQNRGRPFTRNVLLDHMDGDYVAWLDSGDEWFANKISVQLDALAQAGVTEDSDDCWATCSYEWREAGKPPRQIHQATDCDIVYSLLQGSRLRAYLWTILAPRPAMQRVGYFDAKLRWLEDLDFFVRFANEGGRLVQSNIPDALCAYNKEHSGRGARMISESYDHLFRKHIDIYAGYGRLFTLQTRRNAIKNCLRFAKADHDQKMKILLTFRKLKVKTQLKLHRMSERRTTVQLRKGN